MIHSKAGIWPDHGQNLVSTVVFETNLLESDPAAERDAVRRPHTEWKDCLISNHGLK